MAKKCKGKGKGGKKAIMLACGVSLGVAGCKTVPATDEQGNVLPNEPPVVVPDDGAINSTIIALGTLIGGPFGAALGVIGASGVSLAVYRAVKKRREEDESEVVDDGSGE